MNLRELDIVYFVKESEKNEELRYSLRSVDKNVPHRKVWFLGGKPEGLHPDGWIHVNQNEVTKWENTSLLLKTACQNPEITGDFILFNDDFFVMYPIKEIPYYSDGSLSRRVLSLKIKFHRLTSYSLRLQQTNDMLTKRSFPTFNYALHYPMIINKKEMLETFEEFPQGLMWRSLYGNHHKKKVSLTKDCKISDRITLPEETQVYISTKDDVFSGGEVGRFIRERFTESCRFEHEEGEINEEDS